MRSDSVNYGLNAENAKRRDDRFVRCGRCGFICHLDRDKFSHYGARDGWGINYTKTGSRAYDDADVKYDGTEAYDGKSIYDPVVTGGCPQCGTYMYNK